MARLHAAQASWSPFTGKWDAYIASAIVIAIMAFSCIAAFCDSGGDKFFLLPRAPGMCVCVLWPFVGVARGSILSVTFSFVDATLYYCFLWTHVIILHYNL